MFPTLKISRKLRLVILCASALGLLVATGQAAPLYITSGQNNPTVAIPGTVLNAAGSPSPVTSSGNDGSDYRRIHQEAFVPETGGSYYRKDFAAGDTTDPSGWTLTYRAKLGRAGSGFSSYCAVVDTAGRTWLMNMLGGSGVANPHVGFAKPSDPFPAFTQVSSLDPTLAYHDYQMIYNPTAPGVVRFYIDGTLVATEGSYGNNGAGRFEWGRGEGVGGISETQWSLLSFELGQHPLNQIVVQHLGTNNPITEGFVFNQAGTPPPTLTGGNDGEAYWRIYQPPHDGGYGAAYYRHDLAISNLTDRTWTVTMRAKLNRAIGQKAYVAVVDALGDGWLCDMNGGPGFAPANVGLLYYDASQTLQFLTHSIDPTLGYRTYQMVYDPTSMSVRYYVDGGIIGTLTRTQVIHGAGAARVEWGDGEGSGGLTDAQYALIRFEVGPDPHSLILSRNPVPNATGVDRTAAIDIALLDGAAAVQTNMIQLFFNGSAVSPTISKPPGTNVTTVHYDPPGDLPVSSSNTVRLIFNDTATTLVTNEWAFLVTDGRVTIVQHVGMNSPTCEAWTFFQNAPAILSSDIDPEGFWQIQQTNASAYYRYNLASSALTDPSGWTATMRVKLHRATGANTGLLNSYVSVADGRDAWILSLGGGPDIPSSGNGVFDVFGARYTTIDPTLGHRTYQMVYNPGGDGGNGSATYYLDGLVIGTETRAHAPNMTAARIEFGDGDSAGSGGESDAQYALVRFELGQHPLAGLSFSRLGDQLTLSWSAAGFLLQTNGNLSNPAGWADLPGGTNSPRVVTIGPGALFFRLRQQ